MLLPRRHASSLRSATRWVRLAIEALEDRLTPAPIVVTKATDTGAVGDIRWAFDQANKARGPATIDFKIPGAGVHTIGLSGPLQLNNPSTTIDGFIDSCATNAAPGRCSRTMRYEQTSRNST